MTDHSELVDQLGWHSENPDTGKLELSNPLGPKAAEVITALETEVMQLQKDVERLWSERNIAYAKVKGWEATVYVEGLPLRAVRVDEFGPNEGDTTSIPEITPSRLTDLLDELHRLRAAQRGEP